MIDDMSRVTIMSVGVWQYEFMRRLSGPERDVKNLGDILFRDPDIAIFEERQYQELLNPTSDQLRQAISQYIYNRSADNDILLFYFSGHGAPIGNNDFAFCTVDTQHLSQEETILPMTAVSFIDIIRTLWLKKVTPIFIIDTCFSGMASGAILGSIGQLLEELKGEIQRKYASSYALLCSAPDDKEVLDNPNGEGGLLVGSMVALAQKGINPRDKRSTAVTLTKLFPHLRKSVEAQAIGPTPLLLLGESMPDFSIFKNILYRPLEYRLHPHLVAVLSALWNNGELRELRPGEIADITGLKGAYGNHSKLSYEPWNLVETNANRRRLNSRGIAFMKGEIKVPRDIVRDNDKDTYVARPDSDLVGIQDYL